MSQVVDDKNILNLFTVGSHHRKNSVIFLTQNIYEKGKYARTISLNTHYFILFKNRRANNASRSTNLSGRNKVF